MDILNGIEPNLKELGCLDGLSGGGNHGTDEVNAVNGSGNAIKRRNLARELGDADGFRTGTYKDGHTAVALSWKGEGQFKAGACFEGDLRVEVDSGAGDVAELASMEFRGMMPGQTNLDRKINLVPSCLSALSHMPPLPDWMHERGQR